MKTPILILHGWGCWGGKYHEIQEIFEEKEFTVYAPDLPGFGSEPLVKPVMNLDDYVKFLYGFLQKHNIKKIIVVAHSFGGRVAAKFIYRHQGIVEKLIITGSPLIKHELSSKKQFVAKIARFGRRMMFIIPSPLHKIIRWIMYRSIGEWDYYKARELRRTFVQIVGEDCSVYLSSIDIPTLVIWGINEMVVTVSDGKEIAKRIPHSEFTLIENAGHRMPYENPQEFASAVLAFLR